MRTTIDLDPTVLAQLKERGRREGVSLGQLASQLLARGLAADAEGERPPPFEWEATAMGARVDLEDDEALRRALDQTG